MLVIVLAALFVAGSYVAQQYLLPPPKPRMVGIDLGTTFSCVAAYHPHSGHIQVFVDADAAAAGSNSTLTPSVVVFDPPTEPVVGTAARMLLPTMPQHGIYEAKRFIGRRFSQIPASDKTRFPFDIVEGPEGAAAFHIPGQDTPVLPEEVGAHVLTRLKRTAQKALGVTIRQAVMAVPAEFNGRQRRATIAAAEMAGLSVLRLITEPTAAALAYGLHNKSDIDHVLVFDFGGGTLDVSILHVEAGVFTTLAVAGDKRLGGEDLSHALFEHVRVLVANRTTAPLTPQELQALRMGLEVAKCALSTAMAASVELRNETIEITREDFERVNAHNFERLLVPVKEALQSARLRPRDVDELVLVGGSTRVPKVRAILADVFGRPPNAGIDPDEAVARGVAMQAGVLAGAWPLQVAAVEPPFIDHDDDDIAGDGARQQGGRDEGGGGSLTASNREDDSPSVLDTSESGPRHQQEQQL